jgi:photosystem II stability/assembly factor-like uncharacterized protein
MKTKFLLLSFLIINSIQAQLNVVYKSAYSLNDLFALNADTVFVCGGGGIVLSTFNSGITWAKDSLPTKLSLNSIIFSKNGIGFIAADSGTIFKSEDMGLNWVKISSNITSNLKNISFYNDSCGYVCDLGGYFDYSIYQTNDNGKTWNLFASKEYIRAFAAFGKDTLYVGTVDSLSYTYNAGVTWISNEVPAEGVYGMSWLSNCIGYISYGYQIFKTEDAGKTFKYFTAVDPFANNLAVISDSIMYIGSTSLSTWSLSKTTDKGSTWEKNSFIYPYDLAFLNKDTGFVIGLYAETMYKWYNGIFKTDNGSVYCDNCQIVGVNTNKDEYEKIKIVPNPIEDISIIAIPEEFKDCLFQLYNSKGQKIDEKIISSPNTYINKGNKPTGIYYYRLINEKSDIYTGKLIIN